VTVRGVETHTSSSSPARPAVDRWRVAACPGGAHAPSLL